MSSGPLAQW